MKIGLYGKRKIILYFLMGIALPCLLLSYFAFRGIQNDRALSQQQRLDETNRRTQRVLQALRLQLSENETMLEHILTTTKTTTRTELLDSLQALKKRSSRIEEFFWFYLTTGTIEVLTADLLFFFAADSSMANFAESTLPIAAFQTGQEYEFNKQAMDLAINHYKQALTLAQLPQQQALVLNALARVQKKARLFQTAQQSYQRLNHDYGHLVSANGIPYGLAAQVEAGGIAIVIKDTVTAVQTFLNAFNQLQNGTWLLDKSTYQFWSSVLTDSLHQIFAHHAQDPDSHQVMFQKILAQEEIQMQSTERLLTFQAHASKELVRACSSGPLVRQHLSFTLENYHFDVSLLPALKVKMDLAQTVAGIIWRSDAITEALVTALERENFADDHIYWRIVADNNREVARRAGFSVVDSPLFIKTPLSNHFPTWTLELYQGNPHLIENLLISRRSIYFYIFVLIAGILGFGLIISLRSVAHEMELIKIKSDFVSTISHEFKSPLTSIRQLTEMLQTGRVPSQERRQKYYDVILEQGEKLSLLIDNILDFSRMEEGRRRFDFQLTDLAVLLRNVVATVQQRVLPQGFELNLELVEPLPAIKVDRLALIQAVNNLLDNAIKFSNNNKIVQVGVFFQEPYLNISIKDSGIGIEYTELKKIFERFYRGGDENSRMSIRGSGLGLTLVKQIITAHKGKILVESKIGLGSTFTIQLPVNDKA